MYCIDTNRIHKPSVFKILFRVLSPEDDRRCQTAPQVLRHTTRASKQSERIPKAPNSAGKPTNLSLQSLLRKKKGFLKERSQNILVSLVMTLTRNN